MVWFDYTLRWHFVYLVYIKRHIVLDMADKTKKEIDFEKTQSMIVDYIDFRKSMEWFAPAMAAIGILLMVLTGIFGTLYVPTLTDEMLTTTVAGVIGIFLGIGGFMLIMGVIFSVKLLYKRSDTFRRMHSVHNSVIRKSYFIHFELVDATGNTRLEKLMNHLGLVFPEIKRKLTKLESHERPIDELQKRHNFLKKVNFLNKYDLVLKTTMGLFVVKLFDKTITLEGIEDVASDLRRHHVNAKILGGPVIERVIIVSNSYDGVFNTPDLSTKMSEIKRSFNMDLILEEDEYGYTTVWID